MVRRNGFDSDADFDLLGLLLSYRLDSLPVIPQNILGFDPLTRGFLIAFLTRRLNLELFCSEFL